jgi:hypothetical protein
MMMDVLLEKKKDGYWKIFVLVFLRKLGMKRVFDLLFGVAADSKCLCESQCQPLSSMIGRLFIAKTRLKKG